MSCSWGTRHPPLLPPSFPSSHLLQSPLISSPYPSSHLLQSTPSGSVMHGPHKVAGGCDPERVVPQGECLQGKVLTQHLRGGRGKEIDEPSAW